MDATQAGERAEASVAVPTNGVGSGCELHRAAFLGAVSDVRELLEAGGVDVGTLDKHGNRGELVASVLLLCKVNVSMRVSSQQ